MSFSKKIIVGLVLLFIVSCQSTNEFSRDEAPIGLLSEEKFITVFSEMILLETKVIQQSPNLLHAQKTMEISSPTILKKYQITKKRYEDAFAYYADDKEKMNEIYTKILEDYNIRLSKIK